MNEQKEFDKYIKGLFNEDPKVPSELKWEAMDIELPDNVVHSKKSRRKYILFFLFIFLVTSIAYFSINRKDAVKVQTSTAIAEQIQEEAKLSAPIIEKKMDDPILTLEAKEASTSTISNTTTVQSVQKAEAKPYNITSIAGYASGNEHSITKQSDNNVKTNVALKEVDSSSLNDETTKIVLSRSVQVDEPIQKQEYQIVELLPGKGIDFLKIDYAKDVTLELNPLFSNNKDHTNGSFKIKEFFVGYGYNHFKLNVKESNVLKDKVKNVFGQSFNVGLRLDMNKNWRTQIVLKYDRYHSAFDHTRILDPEVDIQNYRIINREEITYHNNFTNTLGLQLGLDRKLSIANHFQIYAGVNIMPTYMLNTTGKTTDDTIVRTLSYDDQNGKLSIAGGLNAGLVFSVNRSVNLELVYQMNQFFFNDIFINDGIKTNQQHAVSLLLTYKLKE